MTHKALAAKLAKLEAMARPNPRIIDVSGAREQFLARLARIHDNTPESELTPPPEEEAMEIIRQLKERANELIRRDEQLYGVKYVSRND